MVRKRQAVVEGGLYHVCNRFARGAAVIDEDDEAERLLELLLRRVRDRDGLTVVAYRRARLALVPQALGS